MRSRLATIAIGLLIAAGGTLAACSSSGPVADDGGLEGVEYTSMEEDQEYSEFEGTDDSQDAFAQPQAPAASAPEATGPVATVDGIEISADEFNRHMRTVVQQAGGQLPPEVVGDVRDGIIEQLVQEQLLVNAIEAAGIEVADAEVEERIQEYRAEIEQSPFAQDMSFEDLLAQQGLSVEEFHELIEQEVAMTKLLEEEVADMPTDDDVRAYYDENPERFTVPESIEAHQLLVAVMPGEDDAREEAQQKAQTIYEKLQEEDADFESVAAEYGENVIAQKGPIHRSEDLGEVPPEFQQPTEIEDIVFALEDGELSEPFEIDHGWLIIQRIEHQDEQVEDFEEVAEQLKDELRHQAMVQGIDGYLAQLEADAEVQLHPENVQ